MADGRVDDSFGNVFGHAPEEKDWKPLEDFTKEQVTDAIEKKELDEFLKKIVRWYEKN